MDVSPLTIPPTLIAEIRAVAEEEHRPAEEVLRDVLEQGLRERRWRFHADSERTRALELGSTEDDSRPSHAYNERVREKIAEGVRSLREGKGTERSEEHTSELQ